MLSPSFTWKYLHTGDIVPTREVCEVSVLWFRSLFLRQSRSRISLYWQHTMTILYAFSSTREMWLEIWLVLEATAWHHRWVVAFAARPHLWLSFLRKSLTLSFLVISSLVNICIHREWQLESCFTPSSRLGDILCGTFYCALAPLCVGGCVKLFFV